MKKRMLAAALSVVMAVSLSACTSGGTADNNSCGKNRGSRDRGGKGRGERGRIHRGSQRSFRRHQRQKIRGYLKNTGHGLLG